MTGIDEYRSRLAALPQAVEAHRHASSEEARANLRAVAEEIQRCLDHGYSATAIAKQLAPRGTRPSWETLRRVIADEFHVPRRPRRKRKAEEPTRKPVAQRRESVSSVPIRPTTTAPAGSFERALRDA